MEAFSWDNSENCEILKGFLKAIQKKLQFAPNLNIYSNDVAFRFYSATGGLVGYIMSIVREAEFLAKSEDTIINMKHLADAYSATVCGNRLVGINPFDESLKIDEIKGALKVVKASKLIKRKSKAKTD